MIATNALNIALDRRLLRHPRAYHLRRIRAGVWLYLDLLARLPAGAETLEVEPAVVGEEMGLPEGTVAPGSGICGKPATSGPSASTARSGSR